MAEADVSMRRGWCAESSGVSLFRWLGSVSSVGDICSPFFIPCVAAIACLMSTGVSTRLKCMGYEIVGVLELDEFDSTGVDGSSLVCTSSAENDLVAERKAGIQGGTVFMGGASEPTLSVSSK